MSGELDGRLQGEDTGTASGLPTTLCVLTVTPGLQEFLRPIVTPFELELALTSKAWTGDYILDFAQLLEMSTFGQDAGKLAVEGADAAREGEEDDEDAPVFSSATGQYRHQKKYVQRNFQGESSALLVYLFEVLMLTWLGFAQTPTSSLPRLRPLRSGTSLLQSPGFSVRQQVSGTLSEQIMPMTVDSESPGSACRRVHGRPDLQGPRAAVRDGRAGAARDGARGRDCSRVRVRARAGRGRGGAGGGAVVECVAERGRGRDVALPRIYRLSCFRVRQTAVHLIASLLEARNGPS